MPTLFDIPLRFADNSLIPVNPAQALQAVAYGWLSEVDPALATRVHDQTRGAKPFALSDLFLRGDDDRYQWQFVVLDDELTPAFTPVIARTETLDLMGVKVNVDQANVRQRSASYQQLVEGASTTTVVSLRFLSPTAFRSGGLVVPLPEPLKCWQSWLSRWNAFAPPDLAMNSVLLDAVQAHVAVNRYDLRTEALRFDGENRYEIGFIGAVTFAVTQPRLLGPVILRQINALADYAIFCGTGHATTRGLGQTRRLATPEQRWKRSA